MMPNPTTPPPHGLRRSLFPTWAQRKKAMRVQAWCLIALSYIALPIVWLAAIDPNETDPAWVAVAWHAFMGRTFTYHLGLGLLAIGLAAALARQKRLALAALPLILFCVAPTWRHYLPKSTPPNPHGAAPLKVMSTNLLYLNQNTGGLIAQIQQHDPDLILFQEYTGHWRNAMRGTLYETYPHRVERPLNHSFGAAIFSKTPFTEAPDTLSYSTRDTPQLRTAIEHAGQTIAVYNIHLMPPTSIVNTLDQRRSHARLVGILGEESRPTILGGDFNFTNDTRMGASLRAIGYADAHYTAGQGPGTTWPVHSVFPYLPIPGLRIDHLYLSPQLHALDAATGEPLGSDHRSIICTLDFTVPPSKMGSEDEDHTQQLDLLPPTGAPTGSPRPLAPRRSGSVHPVTKVR